MKKFIVAAALLVGMAGTAQAAPVVVASIVPNPTAANVPFALENFGSGPINGLVSNAPFVTSTGVGVTFTGASGIYGGDVSGVTRSPFRTGTGAADTKYYLNARAVAGSSIVMSYASPQTAFNLLWGSVDPNPATYNQLTFTFSGGGGSETVNGAQVVAAVVGGGVTAGQTNVAVWISGLSAFNTITVTATNEAFEFAHGVPVPDGGTTLALLGGVLMGLGALRRKFNV